jgi:glutathione synthase/RimK-type ligase-like ATP-grasp enzyme
MIHLCRRLGGFLVTHGHRREATNCPAARGRLFYVALSSALGGRWQAPHLFQEWIPKAHEIRLTMVGKRHFAVAIHARSAGTLVDWRTDYDALTYEVIDCPTEVAEQAHGFLSATGLTYGAFDFIVTADTEDYIFLECNAAGQWGWLAEECVLPIAEAIADELTGDDQ